MKGQHLIIANAKVGGKKTNDPKAQEYTKQ
jgi:hypothetical protein